jgi:hypothetical protein
MTKDGRISLASFFREAREQRLRELGFEEVTEEEGRERLALNMALKDWPTSGATDDDEDED